MKTYLVGGAVRDALLGCPVEDRDYVVIGAHPAAMLAAGFQLVGRDFPVFLHPDTHDEYALARTERKTAPGYRGFAFHAAPEVTLEEDLRRRDLTINAIAQDSAGQLIDPYGGQDDLRSGILRHISPAFAEDPVRILRVARFAARFGFRIAPETSALMQQMVAAGEVDHLVPERVWQEISRGLMEARPAVLFGVLRACGALARIAPEIDALWGVPQPAEHHPEIDCGVHVMQVLDYCAQQQWPLPTRFAALCHDLGKATTPAEMLPRHIGHEARGVVPVQALCQRWGVPVALREIALLACREHTQIHSALQLRAATLHDLFIRCDVVRRPERFQHLLDACLADARGRTGFEHAVYPPADYLRMQWRRFLAVDSGAIARHYTAQGKPREIPDAIRTARIAALHAGHACQNKPP